MRYRPADLEKHFKSFKSGNPDSLDAIFASEKERLFDYLMRMNGQVSKSSLTVDEAINVVSPVADNQETLQELLVVLYKTARNFSIEIWNADTSRLENSAYGNPVGTKGGKNVLTLVALEHVVRSLPSKQREILILHERYGFSTDETAELTGYGISDVEETFAQALGITEAALPGEAERVPDLMTKLLVFPIPEDASQVTQNLSMVFKDLKKSSRSTPGGVLKLFFGILLIAGISYCAWRYEAVIDIVKRFLNN